MTNRISKGAAWLAGGAAALAGAAVFNHVSARAAEKKFPPTGTLIDVDGVKVHYTDTGGPGDAIVLIHGNASLVQDFEVAGLVSRLAATHRVISFDRPGYGYSERPSDREWTAEAQAELLATAARKIGVVRPVVVGHSWGTLVAMAWALAHPGEVKALALLAGYYYPTSRPDSRAVAVAELPGIATVFNNAWGPLQTRIVGPLGNKMIFAPAEVPPAFNDNMPFGLMLRPQQIRASGEDGAQMPANVARLSARYNKLQMPIVVLWGDGDKLVGQAEQSERLVAELPTAAGEAMPGVGHMIHHVRPAAVASAILALA